MPNLSPLLPSHLPSAPAPDLLLAAVRALSSPARLRVRLGGVSMAPWIRDGTPAEIAPPPARLRRGMVLVCARPGGGLAIHRLVGLRQRGGRRQVCTKGDALRVADGWWPEEAVLGQVVALYRSGRWVALDTGWRAGLGWAYSWLSAWDLTPIPVLIALRRLITRGSAR